MGVGDLEQGLLGLEFGVKLEGHRLGVEKVETTSCEVVFQVV